MFKILNKKFYLIIVNVLYLSALNLIQMPSIPQQQQNAALYYNQQISSNNGINSSNTSNSNLGAKTTVFLSDGGYVDGIANVTQQHQPLSSRVYVNASTPIASNKSSPAAIQVCVLFFFTF